MIYYIYGLHGTCVKSMNYFSVYSGLCNEKATAGTERCEFLYNLLCCASKYKDKIVI